MRSAATSPPSDAQVRAGFVAANIFSGFFAPDGSETEPIGRCRQAAAPLCTAAYAGNAPFHPAYSRQAQP